MVGLTAPGGGVDPGSRLESTHSEATAAIPPCFPPHVPLDPIPGNFVSAGIDLTSVAQVRQSLRDFGDRYLHRVFTPTEIADCCASHDPAPHLAARFAAKEATIKALMVEDAHPHWTSIEVRRHPSGWCDIRLSDRAVQLAQAKGIGRFAVSLSHEGDLAAAIVVATTGP
jgi:holo-[acyl-carrier protein] synthase